MALSPRIEIRQNQSLAMTPQLQQAIKLLQMNNLALAEFVAAEVEKNPLLELAPPARGPAPVGAAGGGTGGGLETIPEGVTLTRHLHAQIGAARADPGAAEAARLLADELEEDGYLRAPLDEIGRRHRLKADDLSRGLALLQGCDPAGVGARSLRECLALQLRDRDRLDPAMKALLDNLGLAAQGRLSDLQAICGVDAADIADMIAELRALDPKPGLRFAEAAVQVAVPDVLVTRAAGGGWLVELNAETLPRVLVDNLYATRLGASDASTRAFLSEVRASANWLVRALEQRARTMLRVAGEVTRYQEAFFEDGPGALRPLTRRTVAERLGLHESTVSRVTTGKFLSCEQGTFELRFLFSASIHGAAEGQAFSAIAVQDRIRRLIRAESTGRSLSDDKLVSVLRAEGIDIARRTVAKYREGMGIPSSVERKRNRAVIPGS